jgi:hypothetical protein
MQTYVAFLVPAGLAVFAAVLGIVSIILSKRQIAARMRGELERKRDVAYG